MFWGGFWGHDKRKNKGKPDYGRNHLAAAAVLFFPILFGTFFQQLYNAADAMIVGRVCGKRGAFGGGRFHQHADTADRGFLRGPVIRASVIVSQYYGAKTSGDGGLYAVHTALMFSIISGVVIMFAGIGLAPFMLEAMGTPEDVLGLSVIYLRIYFIGIIANLVYNVGAAILRAVGDSKRPLYFLAASCLVNIALDIVLVVFCRLGGGGSSPLPRSFPQLFSAFLVVACLMRTKDMHRLVLKELCLDRRMLKRIIRIGLPAGMQSVMYGLSNVIIQSGINSWEPTRWRPGPRTANWIPYSG